MIAAHFVIQPHDMHKAELGEYKEADPEPKFSIHYGEHAPHVVTHHATKLGDGRVYILFYQFQNFGDKPCEITVWRVAPDRRISIQQ
ncbi:hypothetical protein [Fodinicola acaciae]|uniref:hypothetical protein n=1 Tax=Fodinicola acaciae TaxID=2681555 RepID=UPI0013D0E6BB|nr:hypothetical protein [Fodinicola acaciae]